MVVRDEIQNHYDNVSKAFDVLDLIDDDKREVKYGIRTLIIEETINTCDSLIKWIGDEKNVNSEIARLFIDSLQLGYDITVIIEARSFIYDLLGKNLSEILRIK